MCNEFGKEKSPMTVQLHAHFAPTARIKCVFSIHSSRQLGKKLLTHSPNILEKSKDNLNSAQEKNMG